MSATEPKPAVPKPKRGRFQYSLRTLLLVVSVGGPCVGWIGIVTKNYLWPPTPAERAIQWLKDHQRPEERWSEAVLRPKTPVNPDGDDNSLLGQEAVTCIAGPLPFQPATKMNEVIPPTQDERQGR
jgi:hypothetical protein